MSLNDNRTILVIDNDDDILRALSKRLSAIGFRCITAASGAQGLARFQGTKVDLIRRTSDVPIIFVTGFRDEFKRRLRDIRNVTTLRKPFKSQDLIDLITAALAEKGASAPLVEAVSEDL
jgi:DNA-binding response OmpR family regulator